MHPDFNALPALIALAILVAVFAAISRQHTRERVRLWLAGWILVLLRAAVQFANPPQPASFHIRTVVGLGALELASAMFVVSVAPQASSAARQFVVAVVVALPALVYTNAMVGGVSSPGLYYGVAAAGCVGAVLLLAVFYRKLTTYVALVGSAILVVTGLVVWAIAAGRADYGMHIILAAMNFAAAGLFWYRLHRTSAGVLATVFGFFCWGASFPAAILLDIFTAPLDASMPRCGTYRSTWLPSV